MNCKLLLPFLFVLPMMAVHSCQKEVKVDGVSLNATSIVLTEGETQTLIATVTPEDAANKKVSWESSSRDIATVNASGTVTAVKAGTALITVTTEDSGMNATCFVEVKEKVISVTGVSLDRTDVQMTEQDKLTLTATVSPSNATNKNLIWKSSDSAFASVDAYGTVTAVKAGSVKITVMSEDGGKSASCTVSIKALKKGGIDGYDNEKINW